MVLLVSLLPHTNGKHINPPTYRRPFSDNRGKRSMDSITNVFSKFSLKIQINTDQKNLSKEFFLFHIFPIFATNTQITLCIWTILVYQSKYRKIRTTKSFSFRHFVNGTMMCFAEIFIKLL